MKEISTLIWSEWRRQRKTFLLLFASTVFFYVLIGILSYLKLFLREIDIVAGALIIGFPVLYAVVLNDSFSFEFNNASNSFLLGLPVNKTKIYFAKYFSSLLLFLVMSIAGSLLAYTYIFFGKVSNKGFLLATSVQLCYWLLVHAAVFFCNLVNRSNKNGIIMLIILPVLLIILVPGVFCANMFFFATDAYWLTSSTISTIIILYLIFLIFGWYLWNTRISRDLKCLKPIMLAMGMMFATSALLYCLAYVYVNYQYNSALKEAQKNSLILQEPVKFYVVEVPKSLITFNKYIATHKIDKISLYKQLANKSYSIWKNLWERQKAGAEYLNEPDVKKMYSVLGKTSDKYKIDHVRDFNITGFNTRVAIIFLLDMAYIQARTGRYKDFFKSLSLAAEYCVALRKMEPVYHDSTAARLLNLIYYTVIKLGGETPACAVGYQKALDFMQNDKVYCPPYEFLPGLRYTIMLLNPHSNPDLRNARYFSSIFYHLRIRQGVSSWVRYEIKRDKLCHEAEKIDDLRDILKRNRKLIQEAKNIYGYCRVLAYSGGLDNYFRARCKVAGDKLSLALKIFRCRYGKYPEKLQELCPGILKKYPLDPINGKAYKYKKKKDGFTLLGESFTRHGHRRSFAIIRSYKREYQPWEPREKEKNK